MLDEQFEVCKEGQTLGSGQTTLLKMFGVATAEFGVEVRAWWDREKGEMEVVSGGGQGKGNGVEEMDVGGDEDGFGGFDEE